MSFLLVRGNDDSVVAEQTLPVPHRAGIQRIDLSDLGIVLEEGVPYLWSVSSPGSDASSVFAIGGIRRVAAEGALLDLDASTAPPERLDTLEMAGIGYDALDLVSRWIERHPDDAHLGARRRALLERVGIELPD